MPESIASKKMRAQRETVPFKVVTADGVTINLPYYSPHPAKIHNEMKLLKELPWFEPGKPLHNWMLHDSDFYDEVEDVWGRKWGVLENWSIC